MNGVTLDAAARERLRAHVVQIGVAATARKFNVGREQVLVALAGDLELLPPAIGSHLTNQLLGEDRAA